MPRYFFHITGKVPTHDTVGIELPDEQAAWSAAVESMSELLADLDGAMPERSEVATVVTDADGETVITLRFTGERSHSANRE